MNLNNLLCEINISYSRPQAPTHQIKCSKSASEYLRLAFSDHGSNVELKEYFYILLLNRSNHVIGFHKLAEGGISGCVADLRLAFATALRCIACGIILCHNHPSGNFLPSEQDKRLTKNFLEAGKLLDITVLDHIILTAKEYYSFADNGAL